MNKKSSRRNAEKNSQMVMQYHLYSNPLYEYATDNAEELNVILLGFGKHSSYFLDSCLQVGQVLKQKLTVKVFTQNETVVEEYLSKRPELENFFNINGHGDTPESYGKIFFDTLIVEPTKEDLVEFFTEISGKPDYVLIDFGEDAKNEKATTACKKALENMNCKAGLNYIRESAASKAKKLKFATPIFVNEDVKNYAAHAEIERRAFNVHLVWEKNLNTDYEALRKDYLKPYNHEACIAAVIAIKYKLHDLDLDLAKKTEAEVAQKFSELSFDESRKNDFIYSEHKRWVVEKLCKGYRHRPVEECADGQTKDEKTKTHVCIVKSRPDRLLLEKYPSAQWATLTKSELAELDELDRLSVKLHKVFVAAAEKARREPDLIEKLFENIQTKLTFNVGILMSFQELKVGFKDIMNGDDKKVRLYKNLSETFLEKVNQLPTNTRDVIKENFKILEEKIRPILLSMEYREYKQDDAAMVEKIPFILTYSENISLAIPFCVGETAALFENVAAATVINPKRIIYFAFCKDAAELENLKESVQKILAYTSRKKFRAKLEFMITSGDKSITARAETRKFKSVGQGKIRQVRFKIIKSIDNPACEVVKEIQNELRRLKKNRPEERLALELNSGKISNWLQGAKSYAEYPTYRFDSEQMKFVSIKDCDSFGYIGKKNYITVNDLTALNNSFGKIGEQPTFVEDYAELWAKYKENDGRTWKKLCERLKSHREANDVVTFFSREAKDSLKKYTYLLPTFCFKGVEKILDTLIMEEVADSHSRVQPYNSTACEVVIIDYCKNKAAYEKIFSEPYKLILPEAIGFVPKMKHLAMTFDDLAVTGLNLTNLSQVPYESICGLLKYLEEKHYLRNLDIKNPQDVRFTYATREIKDLLTNEGKMLEIYVYRSAKKTGYFDDVVTNFEPHWSDKDINNEFDCVLTRGFQMLIVECKAQNQLRQESYFKLFGLTKKFGVNAKAVLVAETRKATAGNKIQESRGAELEILTLQEDLDHIGEQLKNLFEKGTRSTH